MAFTDSDKNGVVDSFTVHTVELVGSESTAMDLHTPATLPLWPRMLTASLHSFVICATAAVIGLLGHTLVGYSGTTGINFGGSVLSWPNDIDLHPTDFFLTVSAITLVVSAIGLYFTLVRLKHSSFTFIEMVLALSSILILILWIAADFLETHSEKTPKKSLLAWACRRVSSPTNILVSYASICQEQVGLPHAV